VAKKHTMTAESLELVAGRFKVLAEPARLRLLQSLSAGEASVGMLAKALVTTQPNVSKHLRILQDAGLVARRQDGNTVFYSIADPTVFDLCDVVCGSIHDRLASQARLFESGGMRKK
jgi:DNA-binding transcriptional ArsR family regulator